jgi:CubicO group peptidase (beta-lactamase class C family)
MITRRSFQAGLLTAAWTTSASAQFTLRGTWSGVIDYKTTGWSWRSLLKLEIAADGTVTLLYLELSPRPRSGRATIDADGRVEIADEDTLPLGVFRGRMVSSDRIEGRWQTKHWAAPLAIERGEAAVAPPPRPLTGQRLAALRTEARAPALAAAAARRGADTQVWVDGERMMGSGVAAEAGDRWHLGQITQSMTATLVARLVDQGAVRWEDRVGHVLSLVAPDMQEAYRAPTLQQLLCPRSPPSPSGDLRSDRVWVGGTGGREERQAFVRFVLKEPGLRLSSVATTTVPYPDIVAGAMLEVMLGRSWEELFTTHLFAPLGISTAGFGPPNRSGATDQPVGHSQTKQKDGTYGPEPGGFLNADRRSGLVPSGGVHLSLPDLLRYLSAHRDGTDYLRPESWKLLHTPPSGSNYAMGWWVRGDGSLWHIGLSPLWYAEVCVDVGSGIAAAALTNYGSFSSPTVRLALQDAIAAARV